MNDTDSTSSAGLCVVCGKDTTGGRGFMTLHFDGQDIPLCCPMCYKIYDQDPERYRRAQKLGLAGSRSFPASSGDWPGGLK